MAKPVESIRIAVDVSKDMLDIGQSHPDQVIRVQNTETAIKAWLNTLPRGCLIALEATGSYHLELAFAAHAQGHTLYLLDGYKLSKYRESIGQRAKTDAADARLILRYLTHERDALTPWTPPSQAFLRIQTLLRRRAKLVQVRVALKQSLSGIRELKADHKALDARLVRLQDRLTRRIVQAVDDAGLSDQLQRCKQIQGIGDLTAAALSHVYQRGSFKSADAFIAFIGLDVRVRDSGKHRGTRRLTKKGDPEVRRLLYNAASSASRTKAWASLYQSYLAQGLKPTQALIKLARKLARIAFALMKHEDDYRPKIA